MSWTVMQGLPFRSWLELGCNDGSVYALLKPGPDVRYLGIDRLPKFTPPPPHEVVTADLMEWLPEPGAQYDLVFCDAHGSSVDPDLYPIHERQARLALRVSPRWIVVDDCYLEPIRQASCDVLGEPTLKSDVGTTCWLWEYAR